MPDEPQFTQVDLLQTIIDHSDDGIVVVDERGSILEWNQKQAAITGLPREAVVGRAIWDVQMQLAPPGRATLANLVVARQYALRILESGKMPDWLGQIEQIIQRADGVEHIIQTRSVTVPTAHGFMLVNTVRDVTELKRLEADLRRNELRYRTLFEQASDAIMLENELDEIIDANRRAADLLGYTRAELLALHVADLQAPEVRGQAGRVVADELARHNGQPFESIVLRRDGSRVPVEITQTRLTGLDAGLVLTIVRDISERQRAEQALRDSEQRYRALVETSPDGIMLTDLTGMIQLCNRRTVELAGLSDAGELIGRSVLTLVVREDHARVIANFRRVVQDGQLHNIEYRGRQVSGRVVPIEVSGTLITDSRQQPVAVVSVVRDISERQQVEQALRDRNKTLAELNVELQTRNEDLDAFAHTVAHDLKNPLHVIIGFLETIVDAGADLTADEQATALSNVARSARKMNNIIDELLLLAEVRKTQVVLLPLDLSRIVADVQQRLTDMIVDNHAQIYLPATWPGVLGYAPWVEEALVNYVSNAISYGGQPPRVEVGADVLADNTVRLWVRDNGKGLPTDVHARLFTPFSRIDQVRARGHGLGLSIVRRIVEKMGGQVGVQSGEPGAGCLFYFTLSQLD
jgi:PAS domain S-box-containing protein